MFPEALLKCGVVRAYNEYKGEGKLSEKGCWRISLQAQKHDF